MLRRTSVTLTRRLIVAATAGLAAACAPAAAAGPVPAPSAADASTGPRGGRVYLLSEVDVRPELQNRREVPQLIRANYPSLLRDAGIEGTVVARWVLGVDGRPERSSIRVVSATHPDFAFGGEQVAARMRFSPAQVNGKAVRVEVTLPISFTVH